jgi:hypothetical protein
MKSRILPGGVLGESPIMRKALRPCALVPPGFVVESAVCDSATTLITVRPASRASACPECGVSSDRIHSRYLRRVTDLPMAGRAVRLVVVARRFRRPAVPCRRRIFTERFNGSVSCALALPSGPRAARKLPMPSADRSPLSRAGCPLGFSVPEVPSTRLFKYPDLGRRCCP